MDTKSSSQWLRIVIILIPTTRSDGITIEKCFVYRTLLGKPFPLGQTIEITTVARLNLYSVKLNPYHIVFNYYIVFTDIDRMGEKTSRISREEKYHLWFLDVVFVYRVVVIPVPHQWVPCHTSVW